MPTNTPLQSIRLTSSLATITFSNIPQTYTDLVLVLRAAQDGGAGNSCGIYFNGNTSLVYSGTQVGGNGSVTFGGQYSGNANIDFANFSASGPVFSNGIANIQSYANNTSYKSVIIKASDSSTYTEIRAGLAKITNPITSITVQMGSANFLPGSTFDLYGIKAGSSKAIGGQLFTDGNYWYHVFNQTQAFTPTQSITADILVVAGGGGGGYVPTGYSGRSAGGGGAGGLLGLTSQSLTATTYTVTVGAGGSGGSTGDNTNGSNSQFGALTAAVGGGYGGVPGVKNGNSGGSGGGGADNNNPGTFTSGQGYAGANGYDAGSGTAYAGGGGGGAGGAGSTGAANNGGAGGVGSSAYSSWGAVTGTGQLISSTYYYATGGRGGSSATGNQNGTSAAVNTGNGGVGTSQTANTNGMNGGSGIVIVRYPV
jgi:hypothetical protein